MEITKEYFDTCIKLIMDHLDELLDRKLRKQVVPKEYLDSSELLDYLKVSQRALSRYRSEGKIKYSKASPNGKRYYHIKDIHHFMRYEFNEADREDSEE